MASSSSSASGAGEEAHPEREKRLWEAAWRGDYELLEQLHRADPDILKKSITPEGRTAAHVALKDRNREFAWRAAELDPRIVAMPDEDGNTLLHLALADYFDYVEDLPVRLIGCCSDYASSLTEDDRAKWYSDWERVLVNNKGQSLVYLAAAFGECDDGIRCLLNTPFLGSNVSGPNGVTALHVLIGKATWIGLDLIINMIRKDTAIVTHQDHNGDTPLHYAVYHRYPYPSQLEPLLENDFSTVLSVENNAGLSPIFLAAELGCETFIKLFAKYYPEAFLKTTKEGQTACHYAIVHGKPNFAVKVAELHPILLQSSDQEGNTPLHLAIANEDIIFADTILEMINISRRHAERLSDEDHAGWCSQWGDVLVNKKGESLLYLAALRGDCAIIDALLETSFLKTNTCGPNEVTALHVLVNKVVAANHPDEFTNYKAVISKMAQVEGVLRDHDENGDTRIHHAVRDCKELERFNLLLEKDRSDAYITNNAGLSPIHLAAYFGREELIDSFVKYCPGACLIANMEDQTACHYALIHGQASFAVNMAKSDPQVLKLPDRDGNTPLHLAVASYNLSNDIAHLLIKLYDQHRQRHAPDDRASSYDVPANKKGESLLYLAALRGDLRIINALLETPSLNSNTSGPNGVTALHVLVNKVAASNRLEERANYKEGKDSSRDRA